MYKSNDCFDKVERCFGIVAGVDGALGAASMINNNSIEVFTIYDQCNYHANIYIAFRIAQ